VSTRRKWGSRTRRLAGWPLVATLAVTAFVLGYNGFGARLGDERSAFDLAYLSLQLFTVESGNAAGPSPPITLEIARFLAPVATAYALGRALVQIFRHQIEQWRLRMRRGHVVVVGLGWLGLELVERLIDRDLKVVAVSLDLDDEAIASVRRLRVPVVVGDARDPEILIEARTHKASHVVVLAGDDETNAEVALTTRTMVEDGRRGSIVCLAHIRDPQLCQMLRTEALAAHRTARFRLEFFNVAEEAAAIMLDEHASFLAAPGPVRIGVVGGNDVAAAVVSEAARVRRLHNRSPLDVTLAASGDLLPSLEAKFPHLRMGAIVEELPDRHGSLEPSTIQRLSYCDVVFVCLDEDTKAIATTLEIAERIGDTPVVVGLGQWAGMASMLSGDPGAGRTIHPFLIQSRLLDADVPGWSSGTPRAELPNRRRRDHRVRDRDRLLSDWGDLHEEFRNSSRAQVSHLGVKLRAIGGGLAPLVDWEAPPITLSDADIEKLAILEHQRWVDERLAAKWRKGDHRDPDKKTSPYLVPWNELPEPIKELDRSAARMVPILLARAGYQLVRTREE